MFRPKEKKERSLGAKLFLKGERCNSPKCAAVKRPARPGVHGKKHRRAVSEFGQQLMEKQRVKFSYGLTEKQLSNLVGKALSKKTGSTNVGDLIISNLERQLFNVVFKLGFAPSRTVARQVIGHGHICVNGKKVTIPSFQVKENDVVTIKPTSKDLLLFRELPTILKKQEIPAWLELEKDKIEGRVKALPFETEIPFDINLLVDFYSK